MKNSKFTKIFATVASLLVLILAIGIVAGAEGETLSVKINARNVSYGETVKILFAVDDTNAGENEIELLYYLEDPTLNPAAQGYLGAAYEKGYTDKMGTDDTSDDVTYPAFFTAGFPAKNIGDAVYARAHIVGTDVYSEVERYSVVEYLLERLYLDRAEGDKAELYKYLLGYGTYAQKVVLNGNDDPADDVDKLISDYVLVKIVDGTLDGKYSQGTYFDGDTLTPYREGALGWNITVYDLATGNGTTTQVANGASFGVKGFTLITESETEVSGPYKPDLTDTIGRILWNEASTPAEYKTAKYIDYWMGSNAPLEIIDGAPYGESSKIIHFGTQSHDSDQDQLFINNTAAYANATKAVFETDMMVDPDAATSYEMTIRTSSAIAYTLYLSAGTDGNGQISGSGLQTVTAEGICGEWFRLRVEYIGVSDTQVKVAVYYNDMKVAESAAFDSSIKAGTITRTIISATKASVGDMYLDNTKMALVAEVYTPTVTDVANTETYEDNDALNVFRFDNAPNDKGGIVDGAPYGTASKVYGYNYVSGNEVNFRFKESYNGTDTAVFETDMMIDSDAESTIKLELRGSSNGLTVLIKTSATGAVTVTDTSGNVLTPIVPGAEWFRLRVECKGSLATFYINDTKLGDLSISIDGKTVNRYRFYVDAGSGDMYFDNTRILFAQ